ncbi:hypothetical protein DDI_2632 [Dickeya dianthicola RNS04.9]|nr:hypothetical protein DDI_2632 [Dickeya dianthicola RNS04.9]
MLSCNSNYSGCILNYFILFPIFNRCCFYFNKCCFCFIVMLGSVYQQTKLVIR